jgi:hypothetical protein
MNEHDWIDILEEAYPDEDPEELHAEHLDPEGDRGPNYLPDPDLDGEAYAGPPVGTYAHTAWLMAQSGLMDGDEADRWKDEMKEADLF